jgi:outer membrane protein OmpA-like peptidoglycan-associated protein
MKNPLRCLLIILLGAIGLHAQTAPPPEQQPETVPIYRVTVVGRIIKAINYRNRSGVTKVDFRGTSLMPESVGSAEVQSKQGTIKVDAKLKHLQPANRFGAEYMTFVLWAISPEGRPVNLGEVLPDHDGNATLDVTSNLQAFGMIVTAEPYFAVTQPSDVVVMENFVTQETNGTIEEVDANYNLLRRGQYIATTNSADVTPLPVDEKTPIDVNEARNALRIAKWAGAETYANDTLQKAELDLQNAEELLLHKGNRKDLVTDAREAVQTAEDARLITIRKMEAEEQAREQQQTAAAKAQAEADAAAAAQAKAQAEEAQRATEASEAAKQAADAQARAAQQAAEQAQAQAAQAEKEKTELRARLQQQLNSILQTRDTARGLIMNMSDVLFDFGKYTLKPEAREKLAKLSGILLAYPGLNIEIDGYTDSIGSDEFNQTLSEQRADAVRDYLTQQGVPENLVTAKGFGKANPIASNDTSQGREKNRRVELVVSGDAIKAQPGTEPPPAQ